MTQPKAPKPKRPPGRPRKSDAEMAASGSKRLGPRKMAAREAEMEARRLARPKPRRNLGDMEVIAGLVPGYDPWRNCVGFRFDEERAEKAIRWIHNRCTHVEGRWAQKPEPFYLERWQQAIVANLFGWVDDDGLRRYRKCLVYIPRKNGKSTFGAAIANYIGMEDGEPGGQLYSAAADRDQARLIFTTAARMVRQDTTLAGAVTVYHNSLLYPMGTFYKALSREAGTKHGLNAHLVLVDELHVLPDGELVDVLTSSVGARRQPLVLFFTTADYMRESVCNQTYDYATGVRDGRIEDQRFLPVIWEALKEDDWTSEAVWRKANPNLGVSVSIDFLREECARAKQSPVYENVFKRLFLNLRTEQDVRWLNMDKWDACGSTIEVAGLRGKPCYAALDLSTKVDITALVLFFPHNGSVLPFFWAPEECIKERSRKDRVQYGVWVASGELLTCPGNAIDQDLVRAKLLELRGLYSIVDVAVDPWQSHKIQGELQGEGFKVTQFGQGFASMTDPTKELEAMVLDRIIRHGNHPVLRWMAGNVSVETDAAGNYKPSKKKSTERIDGIVALIMAIGRWLAKEQATGPSVYEERGIRTL